MHLRCVSGTHEPTTHRHKEAALRHFLGDAREPPPASPAATALYLVRCLWACSCSRRWEAMPRGCDCGANGAAARAQRRSGAASADRGRGS